MPKPPEKSEPAARDVEAHDEVYFRHASGPKAGRVLARGKHGCIIEADGRRHKVKWDGLLGHRVRVRSDMKVVDQGEDGMIVASADGRRRYVHDPVPSEPGGGQVVHKSLTPAVLFFAPRADLVKAIANRPGLTLQDVTDRAGNQTKRWKRTAEPVKSQRKAAAPKVSGGEHHSAEAPAADKPKRGAKVGFSVGSLKGKGEVVGTPGEHGAHVRDEAGHEHKVLYSQMESGHSGVAEGEPSKTGARPTGEAKEFSAVAHAAKTHDLSATAGDILKKFPPNTADLIRQAEERLSSVRQTIDEHKVDGRYSAERQELHRKILFDGVERDGKFHPGLLSPESVKAATPKPGEAPTFTVLGGRGGSGKSWFKSKVYDPGSAITLDADHIKGMLPEYQGWNAHQVHEESGELFDHITNLAMAAGLNIVHDATMKTPAKAKALVERFQGDGYRVEAHYMHLPPQRAAERAVGRFLTDKGDGSGRYVPVDVVLGMKTNEESFDLIRPMVDKWSFRSNDVERDQEPQLLAEGEKKT